MMVLLLGSLFAVLLGTNAFAQLEVHPRITLEEEYTDNLFLTNTGEQEDWITTIEPGINLLFNSRSVELSLDYSLHYVSYVDNSDDNIDDFKDIQRADARAVFFGGRPFTLTLSETITREALDERDSNADFNELVNRSTVYRTLAAPEYRLQLAPSFSLVFGYTYDRIDYAEAAGNDSEEHIGSFSVVKELSSNTEIFVRYVYTVHQSDIDDDFDLQNYVLGLTQQFGPRLRASIEGGFSKVEYDNGFDSDDINWLLNANYRLSEALTLGAGFEQSYVTSATEGLTKTRSANLNAIYEKNNLSAGAEIFWRFEDFVLTSREDTSLGARLDTTIPLTRVFNATFDAELERLNYEPENEDVDRLTFGAALGFEYRRFLASLGYRYRIQDSDITANDYQTNIFTLSVSMRF